MTFQIAFYLSCAAIGFLVAECIFYRSTIKQHRATIAALRNTVSRYELNNAANGSLPDWERLFNQIRL